MIVNVKSNSLSPNQIVGSQDIQSITINGQDIGKYCTKFEMAIDAKDGAARFLIHMIPSQMLEIEQKDSRVFVMLDGKKYELTEA